MKVQVPITAIFTVLTIYPALAGQTPAPATEEFPLNQTTLGSQNDVYVALQPGGFVATWEDVGDVVGAIFDDAGVLTVPEFDIRFSALGSGIAAAADGRFVVTSGDTDADANGIFQRRYDAAGTAFADGVPVNTTTVGDQDDARVAVRPNGDYAVVWESPDLDADGIILRLFQADGTPFSAELPVNITTTGDQDTPTVAVAGNGRVIVAWESQQDGSSDGVTARIFNAAGAPLSAEISVNTFTTGAQGDPRVACDAAGNFVVVWESILQDGDGLGVYAQRFSAVGGKIGQEFRITTATVGNQESPVVSVGEDGTFVTAWESLDADDDGIFFQRYDLLSGVKRGVETQANVFTNDFQNTPDIALGSGGRMVIAWESFGQDGNGLGVYARRYSLEAPNASTGQPIIEVNGRKKRTVSRSRISLRGTAIDNGEVAEVQLKETGRKFRTQKVKGLDQWSARVRLKPGVNRFIFQALDDEGILSSRRRVVVTRE